MSLAFAILNPISPASQIRSRRCRRCRRPSLFMKSDVPRTGPPLEYSRAALEAWTRGEELQERWTEFVRVAGPFVGQVVGKVGRKGWRGLKREDVRELARSAREGLERLGPTYVKMGQMLSVRGDVVGEDIRAELSRLQDAVRPFAWEDAVCVMEEELGSPWEDVFESVDTTPVASASVAQVYRGRLKSGEEVAVKVQRPRVRELVSKDLCVLMRAVGLWQGLVKRWTKQEVDYDALVDRWAEGFYGELDFFKEAQSQSNARQSILKSTDGKVYVPRVYMSLCSRRLMISEWCNGVKLTDLDPQEIRRLIPIGQQCFLRQLLEPGQTFHCDPHGGNLLKNIKDDPSYTDEEDPRKKAELLLLDFGLVISIPDEDKNKIVLAVVHMANCDWLAVTEDMVELGFLPNGTNCSEIAPLLERILAPYVLEGGGMHGYFSSHRSPKGMAAVSAKASSRSVQTLIDDLNSAVTDVPFSVSPYWPIVGRSIAILEGIALQGDPNYKIVMSSYPYIARRLLRDSADSTPFRKALNDILYGEGSTGGSRRPRPSPRRLAALLNNALGAVASFSEESASKIPPAFIDFDALPSPEEAAPLRRTLGLILSPDGRAVREIIVNELATGLDLLTRQLLRQSVDTLSAPRVLQLPVLPIPFSPIRLPSPKLRLPTLIGTVPKEIRNAALDRVVPPLSPEEAVYLKDLKEICFALTGWKEAEIRRIFESPRGTVDFVQKFLQESSSSGTLVDFKGLSSLIVDSVISLTTGKSDQMSVENRTILEFGNDIVTRVQTIQLERLTNLV